VKRIQEINEIIGGLAPSIRQDAFGLLADYVTRKQRGTSQQDTPSTPGGGSAEATVFFQKFESGRPSENLKLLAAYHYSQYGAAPFTIPELQAIADEASLVIPARPDMTLKGATKAKKKLFSVKSGRFKPTVHGEQFLREKYEVTKGNLPKPTEDSS